MNDAFDDLVTLHAPSVLGYLARRTDPDTAADVWQEVCLVAWRKLAQVPEDHDGQCAWLVAVARRVLANHRRSGQRRTAAVDRLADGLRLLHQQQDAPTDGVHEALDHLPEADRELVRLVYWDGFTVAQAAVVLDASPAACRKRLQRARDALRTQLQVTTPAEPTGRGRQEIGAVGAATGRRWRA